MKHITHTQTAIIAGLLGMITASSAMQSYQYLQATTETVNISVTVTDSSASSSSSSSSTSSSSSIAAASSTGSDEPSGGGRGTGYATYYGRCIEQVVPTIIERIHMQDGTIIERTLSTERALDVDQCYVDVDIESLEPLTPFADVPAGIWYEEYLAALIADNVIDDEQELFRPAASATRAEMAKVLILIQKVQAIASTESYFEDVEEGSWYEKYIETAADQTWMLGYNNCFDTNTSTTPCITKPGATITRAEAAALIIRAYNLQSNTFAISFTDADPNAWYLNVLNTAAAHCILQGNERTRTVRPNAPINRAEMIAMFSRAEQNLEFGVDCGW